MDATLAAVLQRATRQVNWMPEPDTWMWRRWDGQPQGFGVGWLNNAGQANLLWLALDLKAPPRQYDARENQLYSIIAVHGTGKLYDLCLLAESVTLAQFRTRIGEGDAGKAYPALCHSLRNLADRRLLDANV